MKPYIPTIADLQAICWKESGEELVDLAKSSSQILCEYRRKDPDVKGIFVRKSIAEKLIKVQKRLSLHDSRMQLLVVEGYRTGRYQERYFLEKFLFEYQQCPTMPLEALLERTHWMVALPSVAGHPTGGAVDLTIAINGQQIDMGGEIADFTFPDLLPTFSELASPTQNQSRRLLHDLMLAEGFAPFYGEWWHFSYGDREWAAFYRRTEAIYSPL
jgi:zinc D-Ala-D-Ala dipeptidase